MKRSVGEIMFSTLTLNDVNMPDKKKEIKLLLPKAKT